MATAVKKQQVKDQKTKEVDARHKIKPRGLWGLFEGRIHLNGLRSFASL